MSLTEQVREQVCLLTGELDEKQTALLELLCAGTVTALAARLRDGLTPEDCAETFVRAAALMVLSAMQEEDGAQRVEEFRAGDLTVKRGASDGVCRSLKEQAQWMLGPYLKDRFLFQGV